MKKIYQLSKKIHNLLIWIKKIMLPITNEYRIAQSEEHGQMESMSITVKSTRLNPKIHIIFFNNKRNISQKTSLCKSLSTNLPKITNKIIID